MVIFLVRVARRSIPSLCFTNLVLCILHISADSKTQSGWGLQLLGCSVRMLIGLIGSILLVLRLALRVVVLLVGPLLRVLLLDVWLGECIHFLLFLKGEYFPTSLMDIVMVGTLTGDDEDGIEFIHWLEERAHFPFSCIAYPSSPVFFAVFVSHSSNLIVNCSPSRHEINCETSFVRRVYSCQERFCGRGNEVLKYLVIWFYWRSEMVAVKIGRGHFC